jgi:hypothetical protein
MQQATFRDKVTSLQALSKNKLASTCYKSDENP